MKVPAVVLAAALALAAFGMWWLWPRVAAGPVIDPENANKVSMGAAIYRPECAACHGVERQGQPDWRVRGADGLLPAPPLDGSAHDWHHPDEILVLMVRDGPASLGPSGYRSAMPAFGGRLTDEDIAAVLSFIKNRWPEEARRRQADITRRARAAGR